MKRPVTVVAALCALAGVAAPEARADHISAVLHDKSASPVKMESGDTVTSWIEARNTGATWDSGPVRLGTQNGQDRPSALYTRGDWIDPGRPTALDQARVATGAIGRFTFIATAPMVSARAVYEEHFAPLWENHAWMYGGTAKLVYDVLPPVPPKARMTSWPSQVERGQLMDVAAEVTDNLRVRTVRFTAGDSTVTGARDGTTDIYTARVPSASLPPGRHAVKVIAEDPGERTGESSVDVAVVEPGAPAPDPGPAPAPAPTIETSVPKFRFSSVRRGRRVRQLVVTRTTAGATVRFLCVRRCGGFRSGRTIARRTSRGRRVAVRLSSRRALRARAIIEVRVEQAGQVTRYQRITVSKSGRTRVGGSGCVDAAGRGRPCP